MPAGKPDDLEAWAVRSPPAGLNGWSPDYTSAATPR